MSINGGVRILLFYISGLRVERLDKTEKIIIVNVHGQLYKIWGQLIILSTERMDAL